MKIDLNKIADKIVYIILTTIGTGLVSFNIIAFKSNKGSIYFNDSNQTWFMIGVLCILFGYFVKNWKKL